MIISRRTSLSLAVAWNLTRISSGFTSFQILRRTPLHYSSSFLQTLATPTESLHNVNGIICREVPIEIANIGTLKILEATAESQDALVEIACATEQELQNQISFKVNSGDIYGSVLWPAASAVSDHLQSIDLDNKIVLELGTGTGLCALSAALSGAKCVLATDYEEIPLDLLRYAIDHLYDSDQKEKLQTIETSLLDICQHDVPLPKADIVIAADIMYEPKTGEATAVRTLEALKAGSRVIIGCSPGRPGRPYFLKKLKELLPGVDIEFEIVQGRTCSGDRNELICGKNSTSVSDVPKALNVHLLDISPQDCNL
ncbi:hypothetical protein CTEN210_12291 [Chaetoceros tenuissimus]|uniref:Calmodulin-lysine N-methyltransferase n=1 Tax=Chaetoceros tenuissimus TaxID=426638 RepID=A0AAD3D320_9STRA|nr:hypothetical protein CTEN210_12291 [Chaetoceros tenuissimus]